MPKKSFFSTIILLFLFYLTSFAQNFEWAKQFGGTNSVEPRSIVTDAFGNVYTTGGFTDTADFDPNVGVYNLISSGGGSVGSVFVSKLATDGSFVWAKQMGGDHNGNGAAGATSIALDANNNVYITGGFGGTVDFDPGIPTFNLSSTASIFNGDIFVVKLNATGDFVWAKKIGGPNDDAGRSLALDALGNVYIVGDFIGTVDFDPSANTYNLSSSGSYGDIFVCKLSPAGNFIWARSWPYNGSRSILALDGDGNAYVTGSFPGTTDFNPASGSSNVFNLSSAGKDDIYINKLNSSGNFVWAKRIGGTEDDQSLDITTDANGNVYITGYFHGTVDFDPNSGVYNLSSTGMVGADAFVCKLDNAGDLVWAKNMGGTNGDAGSSIKVGTDESVYTFGVFRGVADFDPDTSSYNLSAVGNEDVFISKLDALGNFVWAKSFGGLWYDEAYAITLDADNNVYSTGDFEGTVDFDPDSSVYNMTAESMGGSAFIHKIHQLPVAITIIENPLHISLYPNPSNGVVYLEIEQDFDIATVFITNSLGQVVTTIQTNDKNTSLKLPYESGVYFVRVEIDKKVVVYKVVRG